MCCRLCGASNFDWGVSDGRSRRGCTASSSFCLETNDPLQLIRSAIALPDDQASSLVPCLLVLKTYPVRHFSLCRGFLLTSYRCIRPFSQASLSEPTRMRSPKKPATRLLREEAAAAARYSAWQNRRTAKPTDALAPNMQGCLLLQSMVGLTGGANAIVLER